MVCGSGTRSSRRPSRKGFFSGAWRRLRWPSRARRMSRIERASAATAGTMPSSASPFEPPSAGWWLGCGWVGGFGGALSVVVASVLAGLFAGAFAFALVGAFGLATV